MVKIKIEKVWTKLFGHHRGFKKLGAGDRAWLDTEKDESASGLEYN